MLLLTTCTEPAVGHHAEEAEGGAEQKVGVRVGARGSASWWMAAIGLLVKSSPSQGDNVADHIKEQLMERDR